MCYFFGIEVPITEEMERGLIEISMNNEYEYNIAGDLAPTFSIFKKFGLRHPCNNSRYFLLHVV